jgi:hypothetical protein
MRIPQIRSAPDRTFSAAAEDKVARGGHCGFQARLERTSFRRAAARRDLGAHTSDDGGDGGAVRLARTRGFSLVICPVTTSVMDTSLCPLGCQNRLRSGDFG